MQLPDMMYDTQEYHALQQAYALELARAEKDWRLPAWKRLPHRHSN